MSTSADNALSSPVDPSVTGRRYHSVAFIVSCIVVCYMTIQMLWSTSAEQLTITTLASYYALIRMVQLVTIRKPYHLPLHLHVPLVIFDQIFLAAICFAGLPLYMTLPLSGTLLFMTRSLGAQYLFISMPLAFATILFALVTYNGFQLNTFTAAALSLLVVFAFSLNSLIPLARSLIRRQAMGDCNSTPCEPQDSKQALQPVSNLPRPAKERSGLRILLISTNDNRLASLSEHLNYWGYDYTTSRNSVQAFRHMLSRYQANIFVPYTTLIVDQQGLDLDPVSLAHLIQSEPKLEGLKLIGFKAPFSTHHQPQDLYQAGYKTLLESPLNKAQLFSALHGERRQYSGSTNIISLCEHRAIKSSIVERGLILIADDTCSDRTRLSKALMQAGFQVLEVDNGEQALDALEEKSISLAVINTRLPIMSGIQVLKLHRFTTPYKQWVPFAFLSDENNAVTLRLCRSLGIQACLFKPVVAEDILEIIPTLLTQHQSADRRFDNHRTLPNVNNVTQFQNTGLLDHMTLLRLERLDSGIAFINDLFRIFETEGALIIRTMKQAVERNQFGLFLDQAQILLDSAGQLGALTLYELSRNATKLRAYEFELHGYQAIQEIEKNYHLTLDAYSNYLSQRIATLQSDHV
jgi:two-component system sensor histidine kinase RpfC